MHFGKNAVVFYIRLIGFLLLDGTGAKVLSEFHG